ncbi:MAG: Arginine--tRNA ligase [Chlamydiae bacterium]|nr:Arginine--tRNA ligase [Chlamydiota bacterium]
MQWSNPPFIHSTLEKIFFGKIETAFPNLTKEQISSCLEITPSKQIKFGHYQCNSAMKLSKLVGASPREIATKLLPKPDVYISSTQIAGPGFINITLKSSFLANRLQSLIKDPRIGIKKVTHPKRIIVEFSSPNTAKELHVGHLRSTIIGDSLARLFEFLGHDVLRLNHVGDWGTPFGMLICYLKKFHPKILSGAEIADLSLLAKWYKESRKLFDQDESFKKASQSEVIDLQARKKDAMDAWGIICQISREGYSEIYDLLDIKIEERGESYYHDALSKVIDYFEEKSLVSNSDGAKCIFLPDFVSKEGNPLPLIIQKSDGGYNYATTDLAALHQRIYEEKANRILHIVDNGQSLHFQMFIKAAELGGYFEGKQTEVQHIPFGLVLGADGTKFKTRAGDSEKLIDLLNLAVSKSYQILKDRSTHLKEAEKHSTAKILGINAVKYADLSSLRTKDYQFSYEKMLQFEGNTAAFLMYAYVRIQSIQAKAHFDLEEAASCAIELKEPQELQLALYLVQLEEVLYSMSETLLPNRLADYLYHLANYFHAFFRDCPVIGSQEEKSRLLLIHLTQKAFEIGFSILGLKTVSRM